MGSLLPGWDSDPQKPPMGIHDELQQEKLSLEKESQEKKGAAGPSEGPPMLSRKSAPSSFVVRKLQEAFPDDGDTSKLRLRMSIDEDEDDDEETAEVNKVYARDKWWRKFSSAHLNEMAREEDDASRKHTYTPQFDLAGGNQYLKKE